MDGHLKFIPTAVSHLRLERGDGRDDVTRDGFAAAYCIYAFVCFSLEMDFFRRDAERFGKGFAHFAEVRAEFRLFEDHHGVDMFYGEVLFIEEFACVFQEDEAIRALPFRIRVREMRTDVAKASGAKKRVAQRVGQNVAIGMAYRTFIKRQLDAAYDEFAALLKAMQVVANAAAMAHDFFCTACLGSVGCCSAWR
jgi:hypothetical protein